MARLFPCETTTSCARKIAYEAARLIFTRQESEYYRARQRVARTLTGGTVRTRDLPALREIRDEILALALASKQNGEEPQLDLPLMEIDAAPGCGVAYADRFLQYRSLLLPLETVTQSPERHPEGDALYHSLQVFALAREELPL